MAAKGSKFKVRNSIGVYDIYKLIRKNHWYDIGRPVKEKEFYAIIRGVNNLLSENIANGETVTFPCYMGRLELRKTKVGVSFVDGKLKNTYPIDWHNTLLLWEKDEEARKKKIRLRHENKWVYHVKYDNWKAGFNNKVFYRFALNTFIKRALSKNIKSGKVDTLW
jgi:hypothetical protein